MKEAFVWDGSWRDIYVLGTDASAWDRLLPAITSPDYSPSHVVEGEPAGLPGGFDTGHLVLTLAERFTIDCHFFAVDEIEFSLDPREHEFEALLSFIAHVGRTVGKRVFHTPENASNLPFVEFDPVLDAWSKVMLGPET